MDWPDIKRWLFGAPKEPTKHSRSEIPQEREWVGSIMGLIAAVAESDPQLDISECHVVIDEERNWPFLKLGALHSSENYRRTCRIGDCSAARLALEKLYEFRRDGCIVMADIYIQSLAFEICRRIEPRWDELVTNADLEAGRQMIECEGCSNRLRIPRFAGTIRVTCPDCKTSWEVYTGARLRIGP